jgi:hypothetical protein
MSPTATYGPVIAFLFFPSVVFWTSGLMKESLAMGGLFLLSTFVLKRWLGERMSWWEWVLLPLSVWLVWELKYYYLAVFLPFAFAALMADGMGADRVKSRAGWSLLIWAATLMFPVALVSASRPNFYPSRFLDVVVTNYEEYRALSDPENLIYYDGLQPTVKSMVQHAPWAFVSGLFRKLPWECHTLFQILSSLENVLLLVFTLAAVRNLPRIGNSPNRVLLWSALSYCTLMCIFLALSTPNFGTLSRYRVAFLPFYVLLISIENPLGAWIQRRIQRSTNHLVP